MSPAVTKAHDREYVASNAGFKLRAAPAVARRQSDGADRQIQTPVGRAYRH